MRTRWLRVIGAVVAGACLMTGLQVTSSSASPGTAATTPSAVGTNADGRALIHGVFFAQGPVGEALQRLPYLTLPDSQLDTARSDYSVGLVDAAIDEIAAADGAFLARFSRELRSGNPYRVDAALADAGDRLNKSTSLVLPGNAAADELGQTCLAVVFVVQYAVLITTAAAVAVAVHVVAAIEVYVTIGDHEEMKGLGQDRVAMELATVLKTV